MKKIGKTKKNKCKDCVSEYCHCHTNLDVYGVNPNGVGKISHQKKDKTKPKTTHKFSNNIWQFTIGNKKADYGVCGHVYDIY